MKYTNYLLSISTLFLFTLFACSKQEKPVIIAEIDGKPIYAYELNTIIKQELFDELNRIHELKKKALRQLVDIKLIQEEASKKDMQYQDFINYYTEQKINKYGVDSLLIRYNISSIFQLQKDNMYVASTKSPESKVPKEYYLKGAIMDELLDSLKRTKEIDYYIYPPKNPLINIEELHTYYRGALDSKVSVIIISDFDCTACVNAHSLYDSIYNDYKNRVKFGYIHYSAMPTLSEIASDAADNQGKFWEFHDSLYACKGYVDSTVIYSIADKILNIDKFKTDIKSKERKEKIEKTINQLVLSGVYATPTIIINGHPIVNSISKKEICHLIDNELSKQ